MNTQQLYIFPEGVTQEGDECRDGARREWRVIEAGRHVSEFAIVRRLVSPPVPQWIAYADRKPTEADANDLGFVMWSWVDGGRRKYRDGNWDDSWDTKDEARWHPLLKASAIPEPLTTKSRAEFEAWAKNGQYLDLRRDADGYQNSHCDHCWKAWQAARKEAS